MNHTTQYIRAMKHTRIVVLIFICILPLISKSQESYVPFFNKVLKNSYREDICSYSIQYRLKSNNDTLTFKYFITLVNKPDEFSYSVFINDSLLEVYYDNIKLMADLSRSEYTLSTLTKKEICSDSRFLFRSMVDESFSKIILDDSGKILKDNKNESAHAFNVIFSDVKPLDTLYYTLFISRGKKSINEYSLSSSISGISLWENWKLIDNDKCPWDTNKDVNRKRFFDILKTFKPKCVDTQNLKPKVETESANTIHETLPQLNLISLHNDTIRLANDSSEFYLVDYWYRSCFPCIKAIPIIKELHNKFDERQLKIISINNVDASQNLIEKFILDNKLPYDVYTGTVEKGKTFDGVISYPTFVIYDSKFQVIKIINGYSDNLKDKILEAIQSNTN